MMNIRATNINDAYQEAWWRLRAYGKNEEVKGRPMLVMPGPITTTYKYPLERVLFNPKRDANPVFHLVEALWMLAGRDDVESLLPFNSGYANYAEPDGRVHGAYGHRWRVSFGGDQILGVINVLKKDPTSRQAVMSMWDPMSNDLEGSWKDRPCNTHIYFDCRGGALNMTVCCRSNDMVWGAYGANVVHFSILQELIAHGLGVPTGLYRQFSNNFHVYKDLPLVEEMLATPPGLTYDFYDHEVAPFPLLSQGESVEDFMNECSLFFAPVSVYHSEFLTRVAHPLRCAYINRKAGHPDWRNFLREVPESNDWLRAFNEWTARRDTK